jgi:hypothetical protein
VQSLRKCAAQDKGGDAVGNPARLSQVHALEAGEGIGVRLGAQSVQRHRGEPKTRGRAQALQRRDQLLLDRREIGAEWKQWQMPGSARWPQQLCDLLR